MTLKNQNQRELFAKKCIKDAQILNNAIDKLPTKVLNPNFIESSPFEVIPMLMEFLKMNDLSMLYLEISVRFFKFCYNNFYNDYFRVY